MLSALITNTLFRFKPFCFQFGKISENHTSFAVGQAISWVLLLIYVNKTFNNTSHKIIFEITVWCAISNLFDELFFDPLVFGWNEGLFVIIITIRTFWIYLWKIPRLEKKL